VGCSFREQTRTPANDELVLLAGLQRRAAPRRALTGFSCRHSDAGFDCGLFSFADDGTPRASPKLSEVARTAFGLDAVSPLQGLQDAHRANLSLHRTRHGF
jgi:hypothetical protein